MSSEDLIGMTSSCSYNVVNLICLLFFKVLLYDLRSSNPLILKDHHYGLPIKSIQFHHQLDLIISADSRIIKMWNKDTVSSFMLLHSDFLIFTLFGLGVFGGFILVCCF